MTYAALMAASAEMGRQMRLTHRRVARECGLKVLPASNPIVFEGVAYELIEEDLTALLPGEEP